MTVKHVAKSAGLTYCVGVITADTNLGSAEDCPLLVHDENWCYTCQVKVRGERWNLERDTRRALLARKRLTKPQAEHRLGKASDHGLRHLAAKRMCETLRRWVASRTASTPQPP